MLSASSRFGSLLFSGGLLCVVRPSAELRSDRHCFEKQSRKVVACNYDELMG